MEANTQVKVSLKDPSPKEKRKNLSGADFRQVEATAAALNLNVKRASYLLGIKLSSKSARAAIFEVAGVGQGVVPGS